MLKYSFKFSHFYYSLNATTYNPNSSTCPNKISIPEASLLAQANNNTRKTDKHDSPVQMRYVSIHDTLANVANPSSRVLVCNKESVAFARMEPTLIGPIPTSHLSCE